MSYYDLLRVTGPNFCAGFILRNGKLWQAAPILVRRLKLKNEFKSTGLRSICLECQIRGWKVEHVEYWEEKDEDATTRHRRTHERTCKRDPRMVLAQRYK